MNSQCARRIPLKLHSLSYYYEVVFSTCLSHVQTHYTHTIEIEKLEKQLQLTLLHSYKYYYYYNTSHKTTAFFWSFPLL